MLKSWLWSLLHFLLGVKLSLFKKPLLLRDVHILVTHKLFNNTEGFCKTTQLQNFKWTLDTSVLCLRQSRTVQNEIFSGLPFEWKVQDETVRSAYALSLAAFLSLQVDSFLGQEDHVNFRILTSIFVFPAGCGWSGSELSGYTLGIGQFLSSQFLTKGTKPQ